MEAEIKSSHAKRSVCELVNKFTLRGECNWNPHSYLTWQRVFIND